MKIQFRAIGKQHDPQFKTAVEDFTKRIGHYFPVSWKIYPSSKSTDQKRVIQEESRMILESLQPGDYLVTLDERGRQIDSVQLAAFINEQSVQSVRNIVFVIGGAFGVDKTLLDRSNFVWSLSKLTFPHQLVRVILAEQVYRACTILRNEKYHHV